MYERMLMKEIKPTLDEMIAYCGHTGALWIKVHAYLMGIQNMKEEIRFPYGNKYGWGIKYSYKSKHICDIFAEKNAFMVLIRMDNKTMQEIYPELGDYAQGLWDQKHPCGEGGWLNYRITDENQFSDLIKVFDTKMDSLKSKSL